MRIAKFLMLIGLVAFAWQAWRHHVEQAQQAALTSPNGFMPILMPDGSEPNTVIVFAPVNCPKEPAQRADALAERLTREGIPNRRSASYSIQLATATDEQIAAMRRTDVVMRGEIPAVLVNGMGKANPKVEEVIAEYRRTRQLRSQASPVLSGR